MMFFMGVLLLGIYSLLNTPIELVPSEKLPHLTITVSWEGMPPDLILKRVAIPIEEEVMQIKWVKGVKTHCEKGVARIEVEFSWDAHMDYVYILLKERLNRLKNNLPEGVSTPVVSPLVPEEFKTRPFLSVAIYGNGNIQRIRRVVEDEILPILRGVRGVKMVKVWGGSEPEIKIRLDEGRLKFFGISPFFVKERILNGFFNIPSIGVIKNGKNFILKISNLPESVEDIGNLVIFKSGDTFVRLKDMGDVFLDYGKIQEERRYNGHPVIGIDLFKRRNVSSLKFSKILRDRLKFAISRCELPLKMKIIRDESGELKRRLGKLFKISLFILGIILTILLLSTRSFLSGLLIFSSIFFSLFFTVIFIYFFKIPLNLLTLSGFALGFGMFVDNSVVVFENILRKREEGLDRFSSAIYGSREMIFPVISSTLTTVIVFFSFAYFQGRLRIYYLPLAEIVTFSLFSSILVSFTLIPTLSVYMDFPTLKKKKGKNFKRILYFFVKCPAFLIVLVLILLYFSGELFYKRVTFGKFISWYSKKRIHLWIKLPEGTDFSETKRTILQFENLVLKKPYQKKVDTTILKNMAFMEVSFPEKVEFSPYPYLLKRELVSLATNFSGIAISISGFDLKSYNYLPGGISNLPYSLEIRGYDLERLNRITQGIKRELLLNGRVVNVSVSHERNDFVNFLKPDRVIYTYIPSFKIMRKFHIDPYSLLFSIYTLINPGEVGIKIKVGGRKYPLEIVSGSGRGVELRDFLNHQLISGSGVRYRLKYVGKLKKKVVSGGIERINQQYLSLIQWDYMGSFERGEKFERKIFNGLKLPPGFKKVKREKIWKMKSGEKRELSFSIFVSLILIYILLSMLYESFLKPFLIMVTLPLSLIGVFLGYVISNFPFDSSGYIGVILLSGIVVNNGIVLVSHMENLLGKMDLLNSVLNGASERIRPIFITSATTVFGVLPLVIFTTKNHIDIWSSLALSTAGGLTTSTLLVPFVIPMLYYWLKRVG